MGVLCFGYYLIEPIEHLAASHNLNKMIALRRLLFRMMNRTFPPPFIHSPQFFLAKKKVYEKAEANIS
jgi:hypothetical protein